MTLEARRVVAGLSSRTDAFPRSKPVSHCFLQKRGRVASVALRRPRGHQDGEDPTPFLEVARGELKNLKNGWSFS
jgi:hypothetical protein